MFRELFLVIIVCIDIFLVSFNYGSRGIKIPPLSSVVIGGVGALFLSAALIISKCMKYIIPDKICETVALLAMTAIGFIIISKSILRHIVRKLTESGGIYIKMSNMRLGVRLYLDDTSADLDSSNTISVRESFALAVALSIDAAATGISMGFAEINIIRAALLDFIFGVTAVWLGIISGSKISGSKHDWSWISGLLLLIIAVCGI